MNTKVNYENKYQFLYINVLSCEKWFQDEEGFLIDYEYHLIAGTFSDSIKIIGKSVFVPYWAAVDSGYFDACGIVESILKEEELCLDKLELKEIRVDFECEGPSKDSINRLALIAKCRIDITGKGITR